MELELINDTAAELAVFRKDQARALEVQALLTESDARQHEIAATKVTNLPYIRAQAEYFRIEADKSRGKANALHKLANTSQRDFFTEIKDDLRNRLLQLETNYIHINERASHPEIYAQQGETEEQMLQAVALQSAGIEAMRSVDKEVLDPSDGA